MCSSIDDGSTDDTARSRRRPVPACSACRSTSASAAPCRPASSSPSRTATTPWSRSTATASTTPPRSTTLRGSMRADPSVDMVCGSRFLSSDLRYPAPISRRTGIHLFAFLLSRLVGEPSATRRRASASTTAGDRPVRPRLPARLPRGRGGADAAPPPPADARGAGADVPARGRRVLDELGQVGVLHDQGAAGPLHRPGRRRPVLEAGGPRAGPRSRGSDGHADPDHRHRRRWRCCCSSCSSSCAAARLLERYALLWLGAASFLLASRLWRDPLEPSPSCSASPTRRTRCSSSPSRSSSCCCCTSRSRSRGSPTSPRSSPSGSRSWRSACRRRDGAGPGAAGVSAADRPSSTVA